MTNSTPSAATLKVKLYADGADRDSMLKMYRENIVSGFTTNPSLLKKAGVRDYRAFAKEILTTISDRPISFEVFADDFRDMERQASEIAQWGKNVYVKIPITNSEGQSSIPLIQKLSHSKVQLNVTALLTLSQVHETVQAVKGGAPTVVSVFAGRVSDTGRDATALMMAAREICALEPKAELLWASTREVYNIIQADQTGCQIITVPFDILAKLSGLGKDLTQLSLDTVRTFKKDAEQAGFEL